MIKKGLISKGDPSLESLRRTSFCRLSEVKTKRRRKTTLIISLNGWPLHGWTDFTDIKCTLTFWFIYRNNGDFFLTSPPTPFTAIQKLPVPVFCWLHLFVVCQLVMTLFLSEYLQCLCRRALSGFRSVTLVHTQLEKPATNVCWRYWLTARYEQRCTLYVCV